MNINIIIVLILIIIKIFICISLYNNCYKSSFNKNTKKELNDIYIKKDIVKCLSEFHVDCDKYLNDVLLKKQDYNNLIDIVILKNLLMNQLLPLQLKMDSNTKKEKELEKLNSKENQILKKIKKYNSEKEFKDKLIKKELDIKISNLINNKTK